MERKATLKFLYASWLRDWNWELHNYQGHALARGPGGYCSAQSARRGFVAAKRHCIRGDYDVDVTHAS